MSRPKALNLPHLLSTLPNNGISSLVRPVKAAPNTFYQVMRCKLKYRLRDADRPTPATSAASGSGSSSSVKGTSPYISYFEPTSNILEQLEKKEVIARGKAWGLRYFRGELVLPFSKIALADDEIPGGLKSGWVTVDPSTLSEATREMLAKSEEIVKERSEAREKELQDRRTAKQERVKEHSLKKTPILEAR